MEKVRYRLPLVYLALALFAAGTAVKLSSPLVEWDYISILQAAAWAKGGKFFVPDHPPLYSFLLSLFSGHSYSLVLFRVLNLLAVSLTAILLYVFSRKYLGKRLSLMAAVFYLLTPAVIQGVSVLDYADTSWLPLVFLLLLKLAADLGAGFSAGGWLALAATAVLCLSFKITSSAVLFAAFPVYWVFAGKEVRKTFLPVLSALAAGSLVFYAGWEIAAPHLFAAGAAPASFAIAKATVLERLSSAFTAESAGKWLVYLAAMVFWFSPFVLALLARPFLKSGGEAGAPVPAEVRFLYFAGLSYFIGYFLVGGLNHGFPRYQLGAWPLLVFLSIFGCREALAGFIEKDLFRSAGIAVLAALPGILFLADPLRLLNLGLKEAVLAGTGLWPAAGGLAAVFIFYLFLIWLYSRRSGNGGFASLMTAALAFYLITGVTQMKAHYLTSYEYGAAGKAELAAGLRASLPLGAGIFATPGLLYYIRPDRFPEYGTSDWNSAEAISSVLAGRSPEVVILGSGSNTLEQFRLFLYDPGFSEFLKEYYVPGRTGTFLVWRKKARPEIK